MKRNELRGQLASISGTTNDQKNEFPLVTVVGREGLEPPTPCASCRCSSQLS